ncbi:MAG: hypothetical protein KF696_12600 [Planctomycetes bacterium]|nr:hypothetical protein [Planctomycetota bacterium]MCW8135928.1 hypothetical protein [Planctomycetota bacterium]
MDWIYASYGAGKLERTRRITVRKDEHPAHALARGIKEMQRASLAMFGHGVTLSHFNRKEISAAYRRFPESVVPKKPSLRQWSGNSGTSSSFGWNPPGAGGRQAFPPEVREVLAEAILSPDAPGSVSLLGDRLLTVFFLCDGCVWDKEHHPLWGSSTCSTVRTTAKWRKLHSLAQGGAAALVRHFLWKTFGQKAMPFESIIPTYDDPLSRIPSVGLQIPEPTIQPVVHERLYTTAELAREAPDCRFSSLVYGPQDLAAIVLEALRFAIDGQRAYFRYRDGTRPVCHVDELGENGRVPAEFLRTFGIHKDGAILLGYLSRAHNCAWLITDAVADLVNQFLWETGRNMTLTKKAIGQCLSTTGVTDSKEHEHATVKLRVDGGRIRTYEFLPHALRRILKGIADAEHTGEVE